MSTDYPISELRLVEVYLKGHKECHTHYMHKDQVDIFVESTIQLHHVVGNPHHRNEDGTPKECRLDNLWKIRVRNLETETKSYWWCTPDLQKNDDPKGAKLNQVIPFLIGGWVWMHPALLAEEMRQAREDLEEEARGY